MARQQAKTRCCMTVVPERDRSLRPLSRTCQQQGTKKWLCRAFGMTPPSEPGTLAGVSGVRWSAGDAGEVTVSLPGSSAFPHQRAGLQGGSYPVAGSNAGGDEEEL